MAGLGDLLKTVGVIQGGSDKSKVLRAAEILSRGNAEGFLDALPVKIRVDLITTCLHYVTELERGIQIKKV